MQLEQQFSLPLPPARAWPAFGNVEQLVACLPGASLTGPAAADGSLPLRFDVKLGPIAAGFVGSGRVTLDDVAQAGSFEGQAADKRTGSRVRGTASFALRAQGEGTQVTVAVDYALTGALAQFSRGALVKELASALTAQFAARLAERLRSPAADAPAGAAPSAAAAPNEPAPRPAAAPLNGWSLVRQVVAARWRGLWRRWRYGPHR